MLGLFENKKSRFVGIDFGTSAIKVVELSYKNQGPYLENYGWFDLTGILHPSAAKQRSLGSYEDALRGALQSLLKRLKIKDALVSIAIPGFSGLVVLIEFPEMKNDEIDKAIEFEAHKYIPASVEEVSISWEIIKGSEDDGKKDASGQGKIEVLLVAAPKKEIEKYNSLLEGTGLEMQSIELETFAIARALVGNEKGNHLIMDIGSRATNIMLIKNGTVVINRSVDMGGNDITSTIADSLNISTQRAEAFKMEGRDFLNDRETAIVIPVLDLLGGEVKRIVNAFNEKNQKSKIDKLILSGGSSNLSGLEKYFQNMVGLEVVRANPWNKVSFDPKVAPHISKLGDSFSVALGLALRGVEDMQRK